MNITINKVIRLQPLYGIIKTKILPMKTSYKFAKLFSNINSKYEFYQTQISLIINNYSEKDENGEPVITEDGNFKIQKDKIDTCQQKIDELINLNVEVPDIKFTFDELEQLELSVEQFMLLIDFCEEEKADSK